MTNIVESGNTPINPQRIDSLGISMMREESGPSEGFLNFLLYVVKTSGRGVGDYFRKWMTEDEYDHKHHEKIRGYIVIVVGILVGGCLQAAFNLPGGVVSVQDTSSGSVIDDSRCGYQKINMTKYCPGESLLGITHNVDFGEFVDLLMPCLFSLLCIFLVNFIGVPLNHRVPIFIMTQSIIFTLSKVVEMCLKAVVMMAPPELLEKKKDSNMNHAELWDRLKNVIIAILTVRFVLCSGNSLRKMHIQYKIEAAQRRI